MKQRTSHIDFSKFDHMEQLLTKDGKLNAAIIRDPCLSESPLHQHILEKSAELDVFNDVNFAARFWFVFNDMKVDKCTKCGLPRIRFDMMQKTYALCRHKQKLNSDLMVKTRKEHQLKKLEVIKSAVECKSLTLDEEDFERLVADFIHKPANFAFLVSDKNLDFFCDLVVKTESLVPFDAEDLKISERLYLAYNKMKALPLCRYCNVNPVGFLNRFAGYADSCCGYECSRRKLDDHLMKKNQQRIMSDLSAYVDDTKFEILSVPTLISKEPLVIKCLNCSKTSEFMLFNGRLNRLSPTDFYCQHCSPRTQSRPERDIVLFLESLNVSQQMCNRKLIAPLELDIVIHDKRLAIEFDGLFWHSTDDTADKRRHVDKTDMCEKLDYQLIHIFENEWLTRQDIVKSRLKNLLGIYDQTVFARKCEVKVVTTQESMAFQDENHIQGGVNAKVNLGLHFNGELVSLMTFSKPRFDRKHEWELVRFCNKLGHHVPGAASRLLKHFERAYQPRNIVSYADRRWSQGKLYKALGFELDHVSAPNYWYWKYAENLESRMKFQKHNLKKLLPNFDASLSEWQNMKNNGYHRIYDCGNLVFVKTY